MTLETPYSRREALVVSWLSHCELAGHVVERDGQPQTFYDTNLANTYIVCCAADCDWHADVLNGRVVPVRYLRLLPRSRGDGVTRNRSGDIVR